MRGARVITDSKREKHEKEGGGDEEEKKKRDQECVMGKRHSQNAGVSYSNIRDQIHLCVCVCALTLKRVRVVCVGD